MKVKIYGIKNCNTMKSAFDWLHANKIDFEFHDYKKLGVSEEKLEEWLDKFTIEKIVNKSGLTYKKLSDQEKELLNDKDSTIKILMKKNSMIKRPILENESNILLGFKREEWEKILCK